MKAIVENLNHITKNYIIFCLYLIERIFKEKNIKVITLIVFEIYN